MSKETPKDWKRIAEQGDEDNDSFVFDDDEPLFDEEEDEEGGDAGSGSAALDHPSYKALEDKLTAMEMKAHENWDKAARAMAELQNAQSRAARDIEKAHKFGIEKMAKELLPVIDSLEQALAISFEDSGETAQQIHQGVELTLKLFSDTLKRFSITALDPVGELFNPQFHEAMSVQAAEGVAPNTIITVFQKGYMLHDRILRPARVVVAKAS